MNYEYRELSDDQEKLLAILPIPSALLSIFGSAVIMTMAFKSRQLKPWTPYHGLLTAMSACDILSSLTVAAGSFLFPKETSNKVWAFGNDATCTAIGFLTQFSSSALLYNAMLGFYFLATTRFGLSNEEVTGRFEPAMHYFAFGFPLLTAFTGLFLEAYGERQGGISCWVESCGFDENGEREDCSSPTVDFVFGRALNVVVFCSLLFNNLVIWLYFRKQKKQLLRRRSSAGNNSDESEEDSTPASLRTIQLSSQEQENARSEFAVKAKLKRQLKLLSSQAFLFVGSFLLCNIISFVLRFGIAERLGLITGKITSYVEEMEIPYKYFSLMVAQAVLYPLQGFVNMMVYLRPPYFSIRRQFPKETRFWAFRRAIFGESITPLSTQDGEANNRNVNGIIGS